MSLLRLVFLGLLPEGKVLDHILDSIRKIKEFSNGLSLKEFKTNEFLLLGMGPPELQWLFHA